WSSRFMNHIMGYKEQRLLMKSLKDRPYMFREIDDLENSNKKLMQEEGDLESKNSESNMKGFRERIVLERDCKRCDFSYEELGQLKMDTQGKDKNKAKNDKTEHKMEKIEKDKAIRSQKVKSQSPRSTKVNPEKVKVNPGNVKVNPNKAEAEK
nr:hypothetical protein CTI12_AA048040 [Tanacetum cinerariifolium]